MSVIQNENADYSKKYNRWGKFRDNLIWVELDGLYGLINEQGEEIVPIRYNRRELEIYYSQYKDERGYAYEKADENFFNVYLQSEKEKNN